MRKSRWSSELDAATSTKEVLDLARDFLAFLNRDDFLSLPTSCRLPVPLNAEEISQYAFKLMRESLGVQAAGTSTRVLEEMNEFFSAASARLLTLQAVPAGTDPTSRGVGA